MARSFDALFTPVNIETLRVGTTRNFDVFLKIHNTKMVLYHSAGEWFTPETREYLIDNKIPVVYIRKSDHILYLRYIEDNFNDYLADPEIDNRRKAQTILNSLINSARLVFENQNEKTLKRYKSVISSLVKLTLREHETVSNLIKIASRDSAPHIHSVNVGILSIGLSNEILGNNSEHNIRELAYGFFLHDIGKSMTPIEILNKEGPLTKEEWEILKRHPDDGYRILSHLHALTNEVRIIVFQHHERYNGTGYPRGLKGDRIHIYGKICSIVDVFDALTSQRPYNKTHSTFDALSIMRNDMNKDFDPDFFARFVTLFTKH